MNICSVLVYGFLRNILIMIGFLAVRWGMDENYFFPFETIREEQDKMLADVTASLQEKKNILIHAPTGLGKTISTLGPAVKYAIENNLNVMFVTPRHTQHRIAIDTLREIKKKFGADFNAIDFLGKKHMCGVPGVETMHSGIFADFCRKQVEERKCAFYSNTKKSEGVPTVEAEDALAELRRTGPHHSEELIEFGKENEMCSYELAGFLGRQNKPAVIIADYFHVMNPAIRQHFFRRLDKELGSTIVIIDEGHNVPDRVRDLMSISLNSFVLGAAIKEAQQYGYNETKAYLEAIKDIIELLGTRAVKNNLESGNRFLSVTLEDLIERDRFIELVELKTQCDYDQLIKDLDFIAEEVLEDRKQSFIASVSRFLDHWKGDDFGFVRLMKVNVKDRNIFSNFSGLSDIKDNKQVRLELSYRCLDPALVTAEMIQGSYSTIVMSGTLSPLEMYRDLLGFPEDTVLRSYKSPFSQKNRKNIIVPSVTTEYKERSDLMYRKIAEICSDIVNQVPGNSAIFFPSYRLRDDVYNHFMYSCKKTTLLEEKELSKDQKYELLDTFKSYSKTGAVLLGAISGSFSEGIDLPGEFLKCVIVVGVPLSVPDLETRKLIEYYEQKFGKGREYGYTLPAMTRCLQGAGRCIRSETDRGFIAFLDKRFSWPIYKKVFPADWEISEENEHVTSVRNFFGIFGHSD